MSRSMIEHIREDAGVNEFEQVVDRLWRELTCLVELGALNDEETAAFFAVVEDLVALLVRAHRGRTPAAGAAGTAVPLPQELLRMVIMLSTDLDRAFQRLETAA